MPTECEDALTAADPHDEPTFCKNYANGASFGLSSGWQES